jgi:hypothetical protein
MVNNSQKQKKSIIIRIKSVYKLLIMIDDIYIKIKYIKIKLKINDDYIKKLQNF